MTANERPIIVVGCPRSGTTLLSTMLHSHPRIAMPPETRFLLPAYRNRLRYGDLRIEANRRRLAEEITRPKRAHFRDLKLDRAETIERIVAAPPTIGSAFATVWREFAHSRGKPRWGEKRPKYWRAVDSLHRLFPDAQFVHLVRDPRGCLASLMRAPWWRRSLEHSLGMWVLADRELRRFAAAAPDSYHLLRYEDLLADPRNTLGELCAFLGEEFADQMLDHTRAAADIVPERTVWHDRTRGAVDPGRAGGWRADLDDRQLGLIEFVTRRALERYDYPVTGAGQRPGPREVIHYAAAVGRNAATLRSEHARDRITRLREPNPVAALPLGSSTPDRHTG